MMERPGIDRELRVLMLEDTPSDAELAERELRKAGIAFTAQRVERREAFVRALDEFRPDIILSDYNLPDFNGVAALEIVRNGHPEVPVVMVTGALSDIEAVELIHAGARDYVLKDRLARLAPAVQRALSAEEGARARKAAEKALLESEAKYRRIVDTANEGIWVIGPDAMTTFVNARMAEMLGYSREEMNGRPFTDFMFEEDLFDHLKKWENRHCGLSEHFERRLRRKDGKTMWTLASATSILDDEHRFIGSFGMFADITERKQAEENLRILNENLEQRVREETAKNMAQERMLIQQSRLAAMGDMIHNIAHQWRQPINTLALLLANIQDAYDFNDLNKEYLHDEVKIGQELIQRMSTTIDDFRNFFMPNKEKEFFLTEDAVDGAIKLVLDGFAAHNIQIFKEKASEPHTAFGYPNEFAQVVLNALTNTKEAIDAKKIAGEIHIQMSKDDKTVSVSIRDNGGGIPEEILPKVFDPYFTTKGVQGSGVGLYMSKMIMKNMNGDVMIRNVEDGAEVLLTLPLANSAV